MKYFYLIFFIVLLNSCASAQLYEPCDEHATAETKSLYKSMQRLVGAGVIFGHHDDTAYGVNWRGAADSSDVKSTAGSYPALYGWDLARIEHDSTRDINGIPFEHQKKLVTEAYQRGGINSFCWHMDNPTNGKTAWDTSRHTVADIIPGGAFNDVYIEYLDRAAKYLGELKGKDGEPIPILFRPFHEFTGNWFWWCKNTCSPEDFKTLWKFTVDYLRNQKKLHNLLIVYSASDFKSEAAFLERYPGDGYTDILGFDDYCQGEVKAFQKNLDNKLALLDTIAAKHHKISSLAETGYLNIPNADWWTKILLPVLAAHKTSYVLAWRNAGTEQYFVPYPGQLSAADFKKFAADNRTIFQNRLTKLGVYGKKMN